MYLLQIQERKKTTADSIFSNPCLKEKRIVYKTQRKESLMTVHKIVFSPTGGTRKAADLLADSWKEDTVLTDLCDPDTDFSRLQIHPDDHAFIAMPSFGGRAPAAALQRLSSIKGNQASCTLVCVYGNREYEDTLAEMEDTAKQCGFQIHSAVSAVAQHSILSHYASGRPDAEDARVLSGLSSRIQNKPKGTTRIPGNRPYKKAGSAVLVPKPTKECVSCQACISQCPVRAIDPKTLKADPAVCIGCMRCVKVCGRQARTVNKLMAFAASQALKKSCSQRKENELFL